MAELLELRGIHKSFGSVKANHDVSIVVNGSQIHGLVGENGAGKTTLMNILYGLYQPDAGQIRWRGEEVAISRPEDAIGLGIGMVHQTFMLVPTLTVAENIVLGTQRAKLSRLDLASVASRLDELSDAYGLRVDPWATVEDLSLGERQRVEIVRTLFRGADLVILDEPTSVLIPQETEDLFAILERLRNDGKSVIFISHKLREVLEGCDVITVLRDGSVMGSFEPDAVTTESLAEAMVGSVPVLTNLADRPTTARDAHQALRVESLVVIDRDGHRRVDEASLEVRGGEILGVVGVSGNGQSQLVRAIYGLEAVESGRVLLHGKDQTGADPLQLIEAGVAYIPEERHRDGLVQAFTVADNLLTKAYRRPPFSRMGFWLDRGAMRDEAERRREQYGIQASLGQRTSTLSGGNQQRVVLARELSLEPRLLLAAQPTQGLDVRSEAYVESMILEQARAGTAVLLVSTELEQVRRLCDRAVVMFRGRIVGEADPKVATAEQFGLLMAGERTV